MKAIRDVTALLADGRREEKAAHPEAAATFYEEVMDQAPGNAEAVRRLLVIYRRLKNYRKELAVIDKAMDGYAQRGKAAQDKWIAAHPAAAKLGKAVLRSLGGEQVTGFGTNPAVEQLMKRRSVVEKKLGGAKARKAAPQKKKVEKRVKAESEDRKKLNIERKERAAEARREAAETKRREMEAKKAERKAAMEAAKAAKAAKPSLFIVSLRYLVPLEKIDAAMQMHVNFLDKYFAEGIFLVAGRQVPRTGGVVIARARDRTSVERIMKEDPFVKGKLASVDIVEFKASRTSKKRPGF